MTIHDRPPDPPDRPDMPEDAECRECGQTPRGEPTEDGDGWAKAECKNVIVCPACKGETPTQCEDCGGTGKQQCMGIARWKYKSDEWDRSDDKHDSEG